MRQGEHVNELWTMDDKWWWNEDESEAILINFTIKMYEKKIKNDAFLFYSENQSVTNQVRPMGFLILLYIGKKMNQLLQTSWWSSSRMSWRWKKGRFYSPDEIKFESSNDVRFSVTNTTGRNEQASNECERLFIPNLRCRQRRRDHDMCKESIVCKTKENEHIERKRKEEIF